MERTYIKDVKNNLGQTVTIKGFVDSIRDTKYVVFMTIKDITGTDQATVEKETNAEVYVVKGSNRNIVDTIKLTDTDIVKTYTNNVGVYLVYPTYVVNVASDTPYEMIGRLSKYVEFEAIKDDVMYLRTKDNILVTTKVKNEQKETAKSQNTKAE